ncbi:hypothetical protein PVK06_004200 [Gossypium arboreum]|uniref:Uncharacterized protein n=1 Tax=Gossypium arboreum TaxID=29729 RepID=A0ABR0QRB4_GOSAR|nr:hypothetical protein PVK06_004200 [Gossypium arboreum]
MDGLVVTGSVVIGAWGGIICEQLLGKVLDKVFGSRIEMKWLKDEDKFGYLNNTSSALQREQNTRAFILRRNNNPSYVGLVEELETTVRLMIRSRG